MGTKGQGIDAALRSTWASRAWAVLPEVEAESVSQGQNNRYEAMVRLQQQSNRRGLSVE